MNQSKKILAAMLAIPATVIVAGQVQAAEVTSEFEIKNDFVGTSDVKSSTSKKIIEAATKEALKEKVLLEMSSFTQGFTVIYTGEEMEKSQKHVEGIFNDLKKDLNGTTTIGPDPDPIYHAMLYGTFNNVHVKATETKTDDKVTSVKLEFSFNYFLDSPSSKVLEERIVKLTGDTNESILKGITPDVLKVKAIHDYVIQTSHVVPTNHDIAKMLLNNGGSSHAYALWTYRLLEAAKIKVRYVTGMSGGELHSWNLVELGGKWYHLDTADNDNLDKNSTDIKYRYFLADNTTIGGREIYYGGIQNPTWGGDFKDFANIVNPAQVDNVMYYADGISNSKIFKFDLNGISSTTIPKPEHIISEATSGFGKILHYKYIPTTKDTAAVDYLYFINDAEGKYLYQYDIKGKKPQLIIKEQIKSISIKNSILTYTLMNGKEKTLSLNQLDNFDKAEAEKVIKAIEDLVISKPPTGAEIAKVLEARKLYMALTEEQKLLVGNGILKKLEEKELELAGPDSNVLKVINTINALDPLDSSFINKVGIANDEFKRLSEDSKPLVYNKSILDEYLKQVEEAKKLGEEIGEVLQVGDEPFEKEVAFIKNLEAVMTKYEDLLPSLKLAISDIHRTFLEEYIAEAKILRAELQIFINEVNVINIELENYLDLMKSIEVKYSTLLVSQKYLLTDMQESKIETNIKKAQDMNADITKFNDYMETVSSGDTAHIKLTPEVIANMKAADALYNSMKLSQKNKINSNFVKRLEDIMLLISGIVNDPKIREVQAMIEALDYTKLTISELISSVTTADTAYLALDENQQAFISVAAFTKLTEYKKVIEDIETVVTTIQGEIEGLNDQSSQAEIEAVRTKYEDLTKMYKHYVKVENLIAQEARIQEKQDKELAQSVIDAINGLSDDSTYAQIKTVYDLYGKLPANVKSHVTNAQKLLDLWKKVSEDEAAIQAAIDHVNNLIKALNSKSKREDIQAAQDAYDALPPASQALVVDYDKIAQLLLELDGKEEEVADKEAARLVEEKILALNDESTPTAIAEVRAAYEALNENAKKLVSKKMLDLLVFYENSMKEQGEQAKKEAQVIIDRINRITNSYTEAQIKDVRLAYNALSDLAKTYVTNLQKLIDAERNILYQNTVVKEAKLQAAAFDAYMANVGRTSSTAEIAKARAYYNSLSYEAKRHVKTYEKLRRLETMWNDPDYLGLIFTYYPDYINAIKPGGIELEKPKYDSLYIPDDSSSFANSQPDAAWSPYEEMAYYNGRYTTKIEASQVKNVADKTMMLTAEGIELLIPTADIKGTSAAVGVSMTVDNDKLIISFTEGQAAKVFSDFVEIRIPMRTLDGTSSMVVQRTDNNGTTPASYKVEGSNFVIRTKIGGTFTASNSKTTYSDLASASTSASGIRELAKRGITYSTSGKSVIPNKSVTRADVATLLAKALDVSSTKATKYNDLKSTVPSKYVQGLLEAGIMSGVTAQQFSPHSAVSRQEAAIIIANMYRYLNQDLSLAYNELQTNFRDVSHLTYEARQSIAILELFDVVDGTASSKFNPEQKLTRAQFAEMLYKALNAIEYL